MESRDVIEISTPVEGVGEVTIRRTQEEFARDLISAHRENGTAKLGQWLEQHGLTFTEAIDLIGPDVLENLPAKAQWKDGGEFAPQEYLLQMAKEFGSPQESATDSPLVAEMARVAESADDAHLEAILKQLGMLTHRKNTYDK